MKINAQDILSGAFFARGWFKEQYKLVLLISALVFGYIWCGYSAQQQHHHLTEMKKKLEDAQFTQLTIRTELLQQTRQSSIAKSLQEKESPVKECKEPVIYLKD